MIDSGEKPSIMNEKLDRPKKDETIMGRMKYLICLLLLILSIGCTGTKKPDIILEYHRTGGLVGLDDHLTIDREGNAVLKRKNAQAEFALDVKTLNRLETMFNTAAFSRLKKAYLPPQPGADLIEYTITYHGHTVQMMDIAIPEILQPILESLNQIVEKRGNL
jgi:hypothetical protein